MLQLGSWKDHNNPPKSTMLGNLSPMKSKSAGLTDALSSVAEGFMRALKSTPLGNHESGSPKKQSHGCFT